MLRSTRTRQAGDTNKRLASASTCSIAIAVLSHVTDLEERASRPRPGGGTSRNLHQGGGSGRHRRVKRSEQRESALNSSAGWRQARGYGYASSGLTGAALAAAGAPGRSSGWAPLPKRDVSASPPGRAGGGGCGRYFAAGGSHGGGRTRKHRSGSGPPSRRSSSSSGGLGLGAAHSDSFRGAGTAAPIDTPSPAQLHVSPTTPASTRTTRGTRPRPRGDDGRRRRKGNGVSSPRGESRSRNANTGTRMASPQRRGTRSRNFSCPSAHFPVGTLFLVPGEDSVAKPQSAASPPPLVGVEPRQAGARIETSCSPRNRRPVQLGRRGSGRPSGDCTRAGGTPPL